MQYINNVYFSFIAILFTFWRTHSLFSNKMTTIRRTENNHFWIFKFSIAKFYLLILSIIFSLRFWLYREAAVAEKEVEDVDAPKVVDEVVARNGKSDEAEADETNGKSDEAEAEVATDGAANGVAEAEPEVTSTPALEEVDDVAEEAKNGNSTGMYLLKHVNYITYSSCSWFTCFQSIRIRSMRRTSSILLHWVCARNRSVCTVHTE